MGYNGKLVDVTLRGIPLDRGLEPYEDVLSHTFGTSQRGAVGDSILQIINTIRVGNT